MHLRWRTRAAHPRLEVRALVLVGSRPSILPGRRGRLLHVRQHSATHGIVSSVAHAILATLPGVALHWQAMEMRLRLPELLEEHSITPYGLHKASEGRISLSTAYRLTRNRGVVKMFDAELLEALCDVLDVGPEKLLERDTAKPAGRGKRGRGG